MTAWRHSLLPTSSEEATPTVIKYGESETHELADETDVDTALDSITAALADQSSPWVTLTTTKGPVRILVTADVPIFVRSPPAKRMWATY